MLNDLKCDRVLVACLCAWLRVARCHRLLFLLKSGRSPVSQGSTIQVSASPGVTGWCFYASQRVARCHRVMALFTSARQCHRVVVLFKSACSPVWHGDGCFDVRLNRYDRVMVCTWWQTWDDVVVSHGTRFWWGYVTYIYILYLYLYIYTYVCV